MMNCKGFRRKRSWSTRSTIAANSGGTEECHENLSQDSQCPGRNINPPPNTSLEVYRHASQIIFPLPAISLALRGSSSRYSAVRNPVFFQVHLSIYSNQAIYSKSSIFCDMKPCILLKIPCWLLHAIFLLCLLLDFSRWILTLKT
jgi:hypothetical protein